MKGSSLQDSLSTLTFRIEVVEDFISKQFGTSALDKSRLSLRHLLKCSFPSTATSKRGETNLSKRKSLLSSRRQQNQKRRRASSQNINYKESDSNSEGESNNDRDDYNMLLVPKEEVEDCSYDQQTGDDDFEMNSVDEEGNDKEDEWNQCSDEGSDGDEELAFPINHSRKRNPAETENPRSLVLKSKLKKKAETWNIPTTEIVKNAMREVVEEIAATIPNGEKIKNIFHSVNSNKLTTYNQNSHRGKNIQRLVSQLNKEKRNSRSKGIMPEKTSTIEERKDESTRCTRQTSKQNLANLPTANINDSNSIGHLIPKIEMDNFGENDNEDCGAFEMNTMEEEGEEEANYDGNSDEDSASADDNYEPPYMEKEYVPPVLFQSACGRLLVFNGYTYCLDTKPSKKKLENGKLSWRCSKCHAKDDDKCKARVYTWGREFKVLGFMGEHNHPPRIDSIEKEIFMKKLKEVTLATDIPIKEIIQSALNEIPEELKAALPKIKSIQHVLRKIRGPTSRPDELAQHKSKIEFLVKQLSEANKTSTNNSNHNSLNKSQSKLTVKNPPSSLRDVEDNEDSCDSMDGDQINSSHVLENFEDGIDAPWMREDYVAPELFQSAYGRVLVYNGYTYGLDRKRPKTDNEKISWRCSNPTIKGYERCRARIYTFGPDYKVLYCMREHTHPPKTKKIESEVFMRKLKEIARTTDTPVHKIVSDALDEASEELKAALPKVASMQSTLRKSRHAASATPRKPSNKSKIDLLIKKLHQTETAATTIATENATSKLDNPLANISAPTAPPQRNSESEGIGSWCDDVIDSSGKSAETNCTKVEIGSGSVSNSSAALDTSLPLADCDIDAPWMKADYVPPVLFQSASGRVLVFEGYTYCLDKKLKKDDLGDGINKLSWRCSNPGIKRDEGRCKARIYTFGVDFKVLGFLGEHIHPAKVEKVEKQMLMEKLKEVARTTDIPINEIIDAAMKGASEELKSSFPKHESIQSCLRKVRNKRAKVKQLTSGNK